MNERYEPPSDFLMRMAYDAVPLGEGEFGRANLARLIAMTRDADEANRDWATTLLAQTDEDTEVVRTALRVAADDVSGVVRAEAIVGLATRAPGIALPLVVRELASEVVWFPIMQAAEILADSSLVPHLRLFSDGDDPVAKAARDAIDVCTSHGRPE